MRQSRETNDWRDSDERYGRVSRALHWATAAVVLALLATGLVADNLPRGSLRTALFEAHRGLGVGVVPLVALRLCWRAYGGAPRPIAGGELERRLARGVHLMLYGGLIVQPATGILMYALDGEPVESFGAALVPPASEPLPAFAAALRRAHEIAGWVVALAVALHLAGAARHALAGDGGLGRMIGVRR